MAVRILEPGEVKNYITKCPQCGCIFTYQKADTQRTGDGYVECPMLECKNTIQATWRPYIEGDNYEFFLKK